MSDLLARLAERTLRTVPTAQPVLASRFDPGRVMTAPILETKAWSTAGTAPVQDAATPRRPETTGITLTRNRQEVDIVASDAATTDPAKTGMQGSQPDTCVTGLIQMEADVPAARTTTTNPDLHKSVVELSHPLPASYKQEAEPPLSAPELEVINTLPGEQNPTHKAVVPGLPMQPDEPVALEQEEKVSFQPVVQRNSIALPMEKAHVDTPFEQDVSLQREETASPATFRNAREEYHEGHKGEAAPVSILPGSGYISSTDNQKSPLTHARPATTSSSIVEQEEFVSLSLESSEGANRVATRGILPELKPGHKLTPTGAGSTSTVDSLKGTLSHPQSPSPLQTTMRNEILLLEEAVEEAQLGSMGNTAAMEHAIGPEAKQGYSAPAHKQEEIVSVEQHLLVPPTQLQQGIVPQELAEEPYSSAFPAGARRSPSRLALIPQIQGGPENSRPDAAAEATSTPPSIHITIGRIDVRAITSPGPTRPSKPARTSPLLSLDDYLKQGKGGRP